MMRFLLLVAALFATAASAGEVRFPATGSPAVTVKVPDGWSAKEVGGKFQAVSADGATTATIAIVPYAGTLDALAAETLGIAGVAPPTEGDRHAISIVDRNGYWWPLKKTAADGKSRSVMFCDVMLEDGKALTGLMLSPDDDGADYHAGLAMLGRIKLAVP
ncbi:MAG TPA: hypothetical protein VFV07_02455 [Rhizomicrobium sp.]|nr:hypothetical protein [Rhizomicrobium sp.]